MTKIMILSGFLGAGKTTLLKRMLSWKTDLSGTVIIVNDFGKVGIDGALLQGHGSEVIELTSGCICCTLSADLTRTLQQIRERFKPRRIIIESSGISDPGTIASALNHPDLVDAMALYKIITVLDADDWVAREVFGRVFYRQIELADLVLLNKIDLLEANTVPQLLNEIHKVLPGTVVVPTIQCRIDPEAVWAEPDRLGFDLKPMAFYRSHSSRKSSPPSDAQLGKQETGPVTADSYVTFSYEGTTGFSEDHFIRFLEGLPRQMFRIKGPVQFEDRTVLLNYVGGKVQWAPWEGHPETRLAFIGWDISEAAILPALEKCLTTHCVPPLSGRNRNG